MKLILLFAVMAASLISCKGKDDTKPSARTETRRSFFDTLKVLSTEDRITWLKSKEDIICSTYLDSIADSHLLLDSLQIAEANSQMGSAILRTLTLNDILNGAACNYDKYIAFEADSTGAINVELNSDYSEDYSCYSRPLFHGLQKKYNLSGATEFHFFEATLTGVNGKTVVFKIDKINDAFFDFSKWPALTNSKNPL